MKHYLLLLLTATVSYAQQSAIGSTSPDPSAAYEIHSTTHGFLLPRMTQAQRDAIVSPASGLMIYNTETNCKEFFNGNRWVNLCSADMKIITQPVAPIPTCSGSGTQILSVFATGVNLNYQWKKEGVNLVNGGVVSGATSASLTLTNPQIANAGNYEVQISNGTDYIDSYNVPVSIYNTAITHVAVTEKSPEMTKSITAYAPEATIYWYETPSGGAPVAMGTRFVLPTPYLVNYYIEAAVGGCVSTRIKVETVDGVPYIATVEGAAGNIWMAYNLGATDVASSKTDHTQYGSLHQWGRASDGHQIMNWTSPTQGTHINPHTTIRATSATPGHGNFISTNSGTNNWLNAATAIQDNLWQEATGNINNPCPDGFRVPTNAEWQAEISALGITDATSAYASPLKIPSPGSRYASGPYADQTRVARFLTSTISGTNSFGIQFNETTVGNNANNRASGNSLRCIKK